MGHTQCVTSVVWPEHGTIYSASWDHSIRRWDVETGKDSLNMVSTILSFLLLFSAVSSIIIAQFSSRAYTFFFPSYLTIVTTFSFGIPLTVQGDNFTPML